MHGRRWPRPLEHPQSRELGQQALMGHCISGTGAFVCGPGHPGVSILGRTTPARSKANVSSEMGWCGWAAWHTHTCTNHDLTPLRAWDPRKGEKEGQDPRRTLTGRAGPERRSWARAPRGDSQLDQEGVVDFLQHRLLVVHMLLLLQADDLGDAHDLQGEETLGRLQLDQLHPAERPCACSGTRDEAVLAPAWDSGGSHSVASKEPVTRCVLRHSHLEFSMGGHAHGPHASTQRVTCLCKVLYLEGRWTSFLQMTHLREYTPCMYRHVPQEVPWQSVVHACLQCVAFKMSLGWNLWGRRRFATLQRFQAHISELQHLRRVLCVRLPKSSLLPGAFLVSGFLVAYRALGRLRQASNARQLADKHAWVVIVQLARHRKNGHTWKTAKLKLATTANMEGPQTVLDTHAPHA